MVQYSADHVTVAELTCFVHFIVLFNYRFEILTGNQEHHQTLTTVAMRSQTYIHNM